VYDRNGTPVEVDAMISALAAARAVCIGESHPNPHHHWAQLHLVDRLSAIAARRGTALALGMEMFQTPFQAILDQYAAGTIDEKALLSRTAYRRRWGYDFGLYRPIIELAVQRKLALLALNTRRELTKKVSRGGVESLSAKERDQLPELDLGDEEHKQWFANIMAEHGHSAGHSASRKSKDDDGHPAGSNIYAAQVLWDETMAATAAAWLNAGEGRQIIILAGNGHCHDSAIVRRMQRRGIAAAVSVRPIIDREDRGDGEVGEAIGEAANDYLFVMSMPKQSAPGRPATRR
jgi:uncharacterized iron-regulated protein